MDDEYRAHNSFTARFSSLCDYCGKQILAGDTVVQLDDHLYICMACHGFGASH